MENVRKHRDIKLVTTARRSDYLVREPNYHTTKFFTEILLAIECMIVWVNVWMCEFWYDYVKPKYGEKQKKLLYS